jgi:hypothetical protein
MEGKQTGGFAGSHLPSKLPIIILRSEATNGVWFIDDNMVSLTMKSQQQFLQKVMSSSSHAA